MVETSPHRYGVVDDLLTSPAYVAWVFQVLLEETRALRVRVLPLESRVQVRVVDLGYACGPPPW